MELSRFDLIILAEFAFPDPVKIKNVDDTITNISCYKNMTDEIFCLLLKRGTNFQIVLMPCSFCSISSNIN